MMTLPVIRMVNPMMYRFLLLLLFAFGLALFAGCDSGLDGERFENQPPTTHLAVRDTSLVDRLCNMVDGELVCSDDIFTSTIHISWSGSDPDGFVVGYDFRYYDNAEQRGPEEGWEFTTERDTLILLPIPPGSPMAQVVFEVRSIDNEGAKDPNPARTVFPIRNSPPTISLIQFEVPPDTTWTVTSFGFEAADPDGPADLLAVEIRLNDSPEWVRIPPETTFITLVGDPAAPGATETTARVYTGRGFVATDVILPGLLLDADNQIHIRSMDRTEETSPEITYPNPDFDQVWYVQQPKSNVLLVNDIRTTRSHESMPFHYATLEGYLPDGTGYDVWDVSQPGQIGVHSNAMPPVPNPTLRETLKQWDYIYWVANEVTGVVLGSNLATTAAFMNDFIQSGGKLFIQVPLTRPPSGELDYDNPVFDIFPMESVVLVPGTNTPPNLAIENGASVTPMQTVPGTGRELPELRSISRALMFQLPFTIDAATEPLYMAEFIDRGQGSIPWEGPATVASMDVNRQIALLALDMYSRNELNIAGLDSEEDHTPPCLAVQYILEGLAFPGTPGVCPAP